MGRLDSFSGYPSGMEEYLSAYGWHFSKKMCQWAVSRMKRKNGIRIVPIEPYTKERVEELLMQNSITLDRAAGYDCVYVANMCKADYLGSSVKTEGDLARYVKDTIDDPDGYEGIVFTRFYADCVGSGTPVIWEDML